MLFCGVVFFLAIPIDSVLESVSLWTMKSVVYKHVQLEQCVSLSTFSYVFWFAFNVTPIPYPLHSRLKTLLFLKSFPPRPFILHQAHLLKFDHSVFGSHWRWYCRWVQQIKPTKLAFGRTIRIIIVILTKQLTDLGLLPVAVIAGFTCKLLYVSLPLPLLTYQRQLQLSHSLRLLTLWLWYQYQPTNNYINVRSKADK